MELLHSPGTWRCIEQNIVEWNFRVTAIALCSDPLHGHKVLDYYSAAILGSWNVVEFGVM
jgi:hypothetical protein